MTKPKYNKYSLSFDVYDKDTGYEGNYSIDNKIARDPMAVVRYAKRVYAPKGGYVEIVELKRVEEDVSILD
jgi:hypothetical protein